MVISALIDRHAKDPLEAGHRLFCGERGRRERGMRRGGGGRSSEKEREGRREGDRDGGRERDRQGERET